METKKTLTSTISRLEAFRVIKECHIHGFIQSSSKKAVIQTMLETNQIIRKRNVLYYSIFPMPLLDLKHGSFKG